MRFLVALFLCLLAIPAHAGWMIPGGDGGSPSRHVAHYARVRNHETGYSVTVANRVLFPACAKYGRRQCGCTASMIVFGHILDGLPAVSSWFRFPRTSPAVGVAAIWPGRHVEIVSAVNGDGTVDTQGSVGWRHVATSRLIFVDPRGSHYALRPRQSRYAGI